MPREIVRQSERRSQQLVGHRERRELFFQVEPRRLDEATEALSRVARGWDRRLSAIKRLSEAARQEARRKD